MLITFVDTKYAQSDALESQLRIGRAGGEGEEVDVIMEIECGCDLQKTRVNKNVFNHFNYDTIFNQDLRKLSDFWLVCTLFLNFECSKFHTFFNVRFPKFHTF